MRTNGVLKYFTAQSNTTLALLLIAAMLSMGLAQRVHAQPPATHTQQHVLTTQADGLLAILEQPSKRIVQSLALAVTVTARLSEASAPSAHLDWTPNAVSNITPLSRFLLYTQTTSSRL